LIETGDIATHSARRKRTVDITEGYFKGVESAASGAIRGSMRILAPRASRGKTLE
jgi:hypothetical protein